MMDTVVKGVSECKNCEERGSWLYVMHHKVVVSKVLHKED